jgi:hypothetical protein
MATRPEFLSHFPVLVHPGGAEFNAIVPHAEVDIVNRMHEEGQ